MSQSFNLKYTVPGHSDIGGNVKADELARQASGKEFIGPEPSLPIPKSESRTNIAGWALSEHLRLWNALTTCRQTKMFIKGPEKGLSNFILSLKRTKIRHLVGIITGHNGLNKHLYTIGIATSPMCDRCNLEEESTEHFLCRCPSYSTLRLGTLGKQTVQKEDLSKIPIRMIQQFTETSGRFEEYQ